jgi:hypothetical protein
MPQDPDRSAVYAARRTTPDCHFGEQGVGWACRGLPSTTMVLSARLQLRQRQAHDVRGGQRRSLVDRRGRHPPGPAVLLLGEVPPSPGGSGRGHSPSRHRDVETV